MKSFIKIYKNNVYSIIGTLVFHILLVGIFLFGEIRQKGEMHESAILVEIPVELIEQVDRNEKTVNEASEQVPNYPSDKDKFSSGRTNQPSNKGYQGKNNTSNDKFFDENYQREVESAKQLVKDVDDQLKKKVVDINDIQMPEQVTDGMSKDKIKNVLYTGASNIEYHLENRYHQRLPIPVYLARIGGVVVVDITVNREGKVVTAKPRGNTSADEGQIYLYAQIAAQRTVFNPDPAAPALQTGTIRYTFVPQ